jgi:hypothetical protein
MSAKTWPEMEVSKNKQYASNITFVFFQTVYYGAYAGFHQVFSLTT